MTVTEERFLGIVQGLSDKELLEVIDFVEYLRLKNEKTLYNNLLKYEDDITYWDPDISDNVFDDMDKG